jgi:zinc and cadmium transporter
MKSAPVIMRELCRMPCLLFLCLAVCVCPATGQAAVVVAEDEFGVASDAPATDVVATPGASADNPNTGQNPGIVPNQTPRGRPLTVASTAWSEMLLAGYCLLIVLVSLFGGMLPDRMALSHTRMQTIISFVGGLMLGIALFHLLPDAARNLPSVDSAAMWMMLGIVSMFLLIRTFHFHHHGPLEISTSHEVACELHGDATSEESVHQPHVPGDDCTHAPELDEGLPHCHHAHQLSWLGIATGLSLHTLIDGIALAASVEAESQHTAWLSLFGLGTFLAVFLHKPLDAVSIVSLMTAAGWSANSRNLVNATFALMCPAGALLFMVGLREFPGWQAYVVGAALAFSAGVFVCISLSDLLPEMEFHAHNRIRLSAALAGGIALAFLITLLETTHLH